MVTLDMMLKWLPTLTAPIYKLKNKETNKMASYFRGYFIPSLLDTPSGRETAQAMYRGEIENSCAAGGYLPDGECMGVRCAWCLVCLNCGDEGVKRKVFKEYIRKYPLIEGSKSAGVHLPELLGGTVLQLDTGEYIYIEGPVGVPVGKAGEHICASLLRVSPAGDLVISSHYVFPLRSGEPCSTVVAIHGYKARTTGDILYLDCEELKSIVSGKSGDRYLIWEKPEEATKEMTVDEISKALGYKVKVVGSEKADD